MLKRYYTFPLALVQLIVISIMLIALMACATPQLAEVSDRSQPPSRKIDLPKKHHVSKGETLFSIAWRYGLDYRQLANHNRIPAPYTIYPNQQIRLDIGGLTASHTKSPTDTGQSSMTTASAKANSPPRRAPAETPPSAISSPQVNNRRSEIKTSQSTDNIRPLPLSNTPRWQWPAIGHLLSSFHGNNGLNKGIDISGNLGQPVLAAASGQIVYSGGGLRGYGKLLIIKHNETFLSAYAHNDNLLVKEGDMVKAGQRIADMGSSGTDRVKLHFEIRREGTPEDPMKYLPKR